MSNIQAGICICGNPVYKQFQLTGEVFILPCEHCLKKSYEKGKNQK